MDFYDDEGYEEDPYVNEDANPEVNQSDDTDKEDAD
jgi:hypothetical protein